jgi:hypothetical protein
MNPNSDIVVLNALAVILPANTNLATVGGKVYVQNRYQMISQNIFPALHLSAGVQVHTRDSQNQYLGAMQAVVEYCDRWDAQDSTIDAIRAGIAADMEIMMSNAQHNEILNVGMTAHAVSIPRIVLSPYKGELDDTNGGLKLVCRTMTLTVNILPYD